MMTSGYYDFVVAPLVTKCKVRLKYRLINQLIKISNNPMIRASYQPLIRIILE